MRLPVPRRRVKINHTSVTAEKLEGSVARSLLVTLPAVLFNTVLLLHGEGMAENNHVGIKVVITCTWFNYSSDSFPPSWPSHSSCFYCFLPPLIFSLSLSHKVYTCSQLTSLLPPFSPSVYYWHGRSREVPLLSM